MTSQMILSREEVATFARLSGDLNPLHYDEAYAQLVSLMMGLTATYFSRETAMLGLEFTFHFRKAVKADEMVTLEWEVVHTEPKASLQGVIASLDGKAINDQGQTVLTGKGKVLVTAKL